MSDLDDFDLEPQSAQTQVLPQFESEPPPGRGRLLAIGGAVAVLLLVAAYFLFWRQPSEPPALEAVADLPAASSPTSPSTLPEATTAEEPLPNIDQSDGVVAAIVSRLSSHPALLTWLATPDLVRTFAVAVENVATGANPSRHLPFLAPDRVFQVRAEQDGYRIAAATHRRYDLAIAVFTSLDPDACAETFRRLRPLLEKAFEDLGYPGEALEPTLEQAFANILAVEIGQDELLLRRQVTTYEFADPKLEDLSPVAKQLLRLGPGNALRVQNQVRHLARALDMDL